MTITDIITYLQNHLDETDITLNPGASAELISEVEAAYHIKLPDDIRQFYEFTNGFLSDEDMFNIVSLQDLVYHKERYTQGFYIAEFLIYCDVWELVISEADHNNYQIINDDQGRDPSIVLTNSFAEFLHRFITGGLYKGLYNWKEEIVINKLTSSPNFTVGVFKIENVFNVTNRGVIISGQIIEGVISPQNMIIINNRDISNYVNIDSVECLATGVIGLMLKNLNPNFKDNFKKWVGHTINIYSYPHDFPAS